MIKRVFDVVVSVLLLVALSPMYLLVALLVRLKLGSPVLFSQPRPGLAGDVFTMLKFRTMSNATDEAGRPLPDAHRLTRFGRLIRSTSLDELPELINVLRGEMSLVGPRPLFVKYLDLYSAEQARRHEVKPGITGWAQINGRNDLSWQRRLQLDVWYVDNRSFFLDLRILFLTLWKVSRREGINPEGCSETPHFRGEGSGAPHVN